MAPFKAFLLALTAAVFPFVIIAEASTIFYDDFNSGSVIADAGWYSYDNAPEGTVWTGFTPKPPYATTNPATAAPLGDGVMRNNNGTQANTIVTKQWPTVTLAKTGDFITLSIDVQTPSTKGALGVSLFHTSYLFTDDVLGGASPTTDASGYGYSQAYASTDMKYQSIDDNKPADLSINSGAAVIGGTGGHTLVYTITRTDAGLDLVASLDGHVFPTQSIASPLNYSFNSVVLKSYGLAIGPNVPAYFDNISLETNAQ